ncbi:MAG TPA: peptidylprolyl isomerase [Thermoanaerobaculia bacterium]|nr:peptidylprolyl isomerase [Thermoanaerobaculia bacterium]
MMRLAGTLTFFAAAALGAAPSAPPPPAPPAPAAKPAAPTSADVLAASKPSDWRPIPPENTLYLELASGRVVIELAPAFAPEHFANIVKLVREKYFDGLAIVRSQDNYVVQWGDPNGDDKAKARSLGSARAELPGELTKSGGAPIPFTPLAGPDGYAPEAGFSDGFPAGRDPKTGEAWLAHCYGMVGVGRGDDPRSGNGSELYVVIGNAPRHLDRNITVVGRVVQGIELLSTLPRGSGPLGFYDKPSQFVPIRSLRMASDVPAAERTTLEALRTDTPTFAAWVESRRNRRESWFIRPAGYVELCNVPLPVRPVQTGK